MSEISYGILAPGFNATSGGGTTEIVLVPALHEYVGTMRISHVGSSGSEATSYSMAVLSSSGAGVTKADYHAFDVDLYPRDVHDYTIELGAGEVVAVTPGDENISFNFTGMDKDITP